MKRKKFNLKEFVSNEVTPVETRDHQPVRIICTDAKGLTPVITLAEVKYKDYVLEVVNAYDKQGNWELKHDYEYDANDLFFK